MKKTINIIFIISLFGLFLTSCGGESSSSKIEPNSNLLEGDFNSDHPLNSDFNVFKVPGDKRVTFYQSPYFPNSKTADFVMTIVETLEGRQVAKLNVVDGTVTSYSKTFNSLAGVGVNILIGDEFIFYAVDSSNDPSLWSLDLTTGIIKDFLPEGTISVGSNATITIYNNKLYYVVSNGVREVWSYDPLTGSKTLVHQAGSSSVILSSLAVSDNKLYMTTRISSGSPLLYVLNNNTGVMDDLSTTFPGTNFDMDDGVQSVGGRLYSIAENDEVGEELFYYDEMTNAMVVVSDVNPGTESSRPGNLFFFNNKVYFSARPNGVNKELYAYDPLLSSLGSITLPVGAFAQSVLGEANGDLFMSSVQNSEWTLLKMTSGEVVTIERSLADAERLSYAVVGDSFLFLDPSFSMNIYDPISKKVKNNITYSSGETARVSVQLLAEHNDQVIFQAEHYEFGNSIWVYDVKLGGVVSITPISKVKASSTVGSSLVYDGVLYFAGAIDSDITQLWSLDLKTKEFTQISGFTSGSVSSVYRAGNKIIAFFSADSRQTVDTERYYYNTRTKEFVSFAADTSIIPSKIVALGDYIYFAGTDIVRPENVDGFSYFYRCNLETDTVETIKLGLPQALRIYKNNIYFTSSNPENGEELWRYDPATQIQSLEKDFNPGVDDSDIRSLESEANYMVMSADLGDGFGDEPTLYYPESGVVKRMTDLRTGSTGSSSRTFFIHNNSVFFNGQTSAEGRELRSYDLSTESVKTYEFKAGTVESSASFNQIISGGRLFVVVDGDLVLLKE